LLNFKKKAEVMTTKMILDIFVAILSGSGVIAIVYWSWCIYRIKRMVHEIHNDLDSDVTLLYAMLCNVSAFCREIGDKKHLDKAEQIKEVLDTAFAHIQEREKLLVSPMEIFRDSKISK
jgi:hypothetical protein